MRMTSAISTGFGFATALLLAACGKKEPAPADTLAAKAPPAPAQQAKPVVPAVGDAMLLGQTSGSDSAELAVAAYMEKSATNKAVKAFAHNLIVENTRRIHSASQLATQLHLALQPNATDAAAATRALNHLRALAGNDRDTAFVNHEMTDEQADIAESKRVATAAKAAQVKQFIASEIHGLEQQLSAGRRLNRLLTGPAEPGC